MHHDKTRSYARASDSTTFGLPFHQGESLPSVGAIHRHGAALSGIPCRRLLGDRETRSQ